jgi:hypothetical protein
LRDTREQTEAAAAATNKQLFPGLRVKLKVEELYRFAKDGREDSFDTWLRSLAE